MSSDPQSRRIYLSVTQQCPFPRDITWNCLYDKVRHPEKYVGSRDVKWRDVKTEAGVDAVDREMTVGPPAHPQVMRERITWDEKTGTVKFQIRDDDPDKSGCVINQLHDVEGLQVLTFTFNVTFKSHVPQEEIDGFRKQLNESGPGAVGRTVNAIKEAVDARSAAK
jgi:hypothetical protein